VDLLSQSLPTTSAGSTGPWVRRRGEEEQGVEQRLFRIFRNAAFQICSASLWRVLKTQSHLYVFCDQETMFVVKRRRKEAGFRFWKFIVWDNGVISTGYHYRPATNSFLFLEKGKRNLNDRVKLTSSRACHSGGALS